MQYRKLGKSDILVSEISLGCATLGGPTWMHGKSCGWPEPDEDAMALSIKTAVDAGVNHFDNADLYGNGKAERMLARILMRLGLNSEDFIISSKVGHFKGTADHAFEPAHIRHQCEQSLINLKRDYIDLYYFHHDNFGDFLHPAADTMNQLVKEGKVRLKGQSGYNENTLCEAIDVVKPEVIQSWASLLGHPFIGPETKIGKLLEKQTLSFTAFSPLAQGLLLDIYDPNSPPQFEDGDNRLGNPKFHEPF